MQTMNSQKIIQPQQLEARWQEHWLTLRLNSLDELKEHLKEIFERYEHQADVLIDIYKLVFPDWDAIEKVKEPPEAGDRLWRFICGLFIEFDQKHHPKVFNGGLWINNGFSSNSRLDAWELSFKNCKVIMA